MSQPTLDFDGEPSPSPVKLCECGCGEPAPIAWHDGGTRPLGMTAATGSGGLNGVTTGVLVTIGFLCWFD